MSNLLIIITAYIAALILGKRSGRPTWVIYLCLAALALIQVSFVLLDMYTLEEPRP